MKRSAGFDDLLTAAARGDVGLMTRLLKCHPNMINMRSTAVTYVTTRYLAFEFEGFTALMMASSRGQCNAVNHLLTYNEIDINMVSNGDKLHRSSFELALMCGHSCIARRILQHASFHRNVKRPG